MNAMNFFIPNFLRKDGIFDEVAERLRVGFDTAGGTEIKGGISFPILPVSRLVEEFGRTDTIGECTGCKFSFFLWFFLDISGK